MYGDTQVIRGLARVLRDQGQDVRREAAALLRAAEVVPWSGLAADVMRAENRARVAALRRTAGLHEEAADALEAHAAEVDRLKALIARIEQTVTGLIAAARDRLGSIAHALLVGIHAVADPIDQLLDRFEPPPPGSRDWLTVDLPGLHVGGRS